MEENSILGQLSQLMAEVRLRFGVRELWLFGSAVRNELAADSDVDILVDFEGPAEFDRYMDLKFFLEDHLKRKVDLVTRKALRPKMRPAIESEAVRVA